MLQLEDIIPWIVGIVVQNGILKANKRFAAVTIVGGVKQDNKEADLLARAACNIAIATIDSIVPINYLIRSI